METEMFLFRRRCRLGRRNISFKTYVDKTRVKVNEALYIICLKIK